MKTMETFLALCLESAKLSIGEMDDTGRILRHKKYNSGHLSQKEAAGLIISSIEEYKNSAGWVGTPVAMGVGLTGGADAGNGGGLQIDPSHTSPTPLAEILTERFGIPAFIENHVDSVAQAVGRFELAHHSPTGANNYAYIDVGTTLAAACVVNGELIRHGELIAEIDIDQSARLLATRFDTQLHIPSPPEKVDVRDVFFLCRAADPLCVELVEKASTALAGLVTKIVRETDPKTIVLGGGILSSSYIFDKMVAKIDPATIGSVTGGVTITRLEPDMTGLLGAGAVAIAKTES
jgi:predicted NBD/HSP70 family sugar kinase